MDTTPTLLVATHLSSLPSPSPVHVAAHPTRQNEHYTPQSQLNDIPDGHAVYASVLHSDTIGTILLRVTGGSRIVELASISANVPPIRLSLPAPAVPSPSLFFWEDREIHVLVLTETGTLYRLIVPIQHGTLWGESAVNAWIRDYQVKALSPDVLERPGAISMHGHGTDSVVVGLPNGVVLRLDVETGAYDGREGRHCPLLVVQPTYNNFLNRRMDRSHFPTQLVPYFSYVSASYRNTWRSRHRLHSISSLANRYRQRMDSFKRPNASPLETKTGMRRFANTASYLCQTRAP